MLAAGFHHYPLSNNSQEKRKHSRKTWFGSTVNCAHTASLLFKIKNHALSKEQCTTVGRVGFSRSMCSTECCSIDTYFVLRIVPIRPVSPDLAEHSDIIGFSLHCDCCPFLHIKIHTVLFVCRFITLLPFCSCPHVSPVVVFTSSLGFWDFT